MQLILVIQETFITSDSYISGESTLNRVIILFWLCSTFWMRLLQVASFAMKHVCIGTEGDTTEWARAARHELFLSFSHSYIHSMAKNPPPLGASDGHDQKVNLLSYWHDSTSKHQSCAFPQFLSFCYFHSLSQQCTSLMVLVKSKSDTSQRASARHELDFSSVSLVHSVHLLVKTCFWNPKRKYRDAPIIYPPTHVDMNQQASARHEPDLHFFNIHLNLDFGTLSRELWRKDRCLTFI